EIGDRDYLLQEDIDIARENGIEYRTLYSRVYDYGWDVERARTEQPKEYRPFKPIWDKWKETALSNGVGRDLFYNRVRKQGIREREAATTPVQKGGRPQSRWTVEELEIMERNGLNINMVNTRINTLG